ncbi:MAG: ATP-binding cassette domain-containing protein, partial [Firmicutes bacterium]|nr:ATP-binding cassette domain-containing protein [Bacillota bacterium]
GGQKQLLNLAAIMTMQPDVLLLDEPTSQLDPILAGDFLATLAKINRELGTTVILSEHRLEDALPLSDRVLVLENGRLLCDGTPAEVGAALRKTDSAVFPAFPTPMRVWAGVEDTASCPVTVRDGRSWLSGRAARQPLGPLPDEPLHPHGEETVLSVEEAWFKYDQEGRDVLRGLSLELKKGEFLAVMGGNGAGKSTLLSLIAGLNKPYRGRVSPCCRTALLPQNVQALFVKNTVAEELADTAGSLPPESRAEKVAEAVRLCRLEGLLEQHPYDLSGGEQQRMAFAKLLLTEAPLLLLDEPTKGMDGAYKVFFAEILQDLLAAGATILMVSHDVEFCAEYAHRCVLFFDGALVTGGTPRRFFAGNSFYTTAANRMSRHLLAGAVTAEDVIAACGAAPLPPGGTPGPEKDAPLPPPAGADKDADGAGNTPSPAPPSPAAGALPAGIFEADEAASPNELTDLPAPPLPGRSITPLPLWRKIIALLAALAVAGGAIYALADNTVSDASIPLYCFLLAALAVLAAALSRKGRTSSGRALPRRRIAPAYKAGIIISLIAIPLTIAAGVMFFGVRKYYLVSLLVLIEAIVPFFLSFEGKKPPARLLVIIAVLCALGVVGRLAFFMLPQFKPVAAIVIITALAFGGETGFMVGSVTMLLSNMLMGQGPWTPWQMLAMGMIGLLAGVLFRGEWLRNNRVVLSVFGFIATLVVYGGIVNLSFVAMYMDEFNLPMVISVYVAGFPFDLIHAVATALFLWLMARPMGEKLERIKLKYGLYEELS